MHSYDNTPYMSAIPPYMMMQEPYMQTMAPAQSMPNMSQQPMMPQPMNPQNMMPQHMMPQPMPDMTMQDPYTYPQNFPHALQLIKESIAGENEDRLFYQYLISVAPTEEDKNIIKGIKDDEIKHFGLLRQLYYELTGQILPPTQDNTFKQPASYCDGLKKSIMGEQSAVQRYRRILFALEDRIQINVLTEITTDEIRHGILYNYLYSKNGCKA